MTRQEIEAILGGPLEVPERFEPNLDEAILDASGPLLEGNGFSMCVVRGDTLLGVHWRVDSDAEWVDSASELPDDGVAVLALSVKDWRRLSWEEYQIERARSKAKWEAP